MRNCYELAMCNVQCAIEFENLQGKSEDKGGCGLNSEGGRRKAECGMRNAECGMRNAELSFIKLKNNSEVTMITYFR